VQETLVDASQEADFRHVSAHSVQFEQRTGYAGAAIFFFVILAISAPLVAIYAWSTQWIFAVAVVGWIVAGSILAWSAHFWPPIAYRHTTWRLDDTGLEIRRGVLWRHHIAVPVARVQHVDVSQGPIQRMFSLGKLTVYTAGTSNASVELDGLEYDEALRLRDRLIAQKEASDVL
jgi:uncharacterized protein